MAFLLFYWLLGLAGFALCFGRHPLFAVFTCTLSLLALAGTYVGWKWIFWMGMALASWGLHLNVILIGQVLLVGEGRMGMLISGAVFALAVILAHRATSTLTWFGFKATANTKSVFWFVYAGLFPLAVAGMVRGMKADLFPQDIVDPIGLVWVVHAGGSLIAALVALGCCWVARTGPQAFRFARYSMVCGVVALCAAGSVTVLETNPNWNSHLVVRAERIYGSLFATGVSFLPVFIALAATRVARKRVPNERAV